MDIVAMAMAKPKVIKLQDFDDASGESLNNKALTLVQTSLESGGTWQTGGFMDGDTARFLCSVKHGKQYAFEFNIYGMPLVMGATISFDDSGVNQIVMDGTAFNEGGLNEFIIAIVRQNSSVMHLFVKGATVLTA